MCILVITGVGCISQNIYLFFILYIINPSYLLEDQFRGPSSVEGYIRSLRSGCRCVESEFYIVNNTHLALSTL